MCNLLYPLTVILIILIKNHLWSNVVSFVALTYPGSNPCWVAASRTAASRYLEVDGSLSDWRGWWGDMAQPSLYRNRNLIPTPLWDCMNFYYPNAIFPCYTIQTKFPTPRISMMGLHAAQHTSTLLRLLTAYIILEGSIVERQTH